MHQALLTNRIVTMLPTPAKPVYQCTEVPGTYAYVLEE